ncbi:hypothetical protein [Mucilaginibacter xinganensis]|uniref:Outer membrane protein beta-barrel domain-containing protein n=1 Tax=Mucilaginibacter xinganensis TaxID=1234841 RepID=A0A223NTN7_9SPHI|nr:hypothetical protein [Mucilaginibacter xinganensis]ASU33259.1 hypothetical protein MuYL_1361 [Mucilaginibacter xinganensis]
MKKIILPLVVFIIWGINGFAQVSMKPHISIGGEYGLTTGNLSNYYGSVAGGSVKVELPVSSPLFNLTATVGFTGYLVRLDYDGPLSLNTQKFIPIELGARYYFSRISYFEADAGISQNINSNYTGSSSAFIYSPVIGFSAPTNKHNGTIDLGLRFESRVQSAGNNNQLALRLAYRFGPTFAADNKKKDAK